MRAHFCFIGIFGVLAILGLSLACSDDNDNGNPPVSDGPIVKQDGSVPSSSAKICRKDDECSGTLSTCRLITGSTTGMCSRSCNTQNPCPSGFYCIDDSTLGLSLSCAKECSSDTTCPTGMKCGTFSGSIKACVPDGWTVQSCTDGAQKCVGSTLSICAKGAWGTPESCDTICTKAGYDKFVACKLDSTDSKEKCFCDKASTCKEGDSACNGLTLTQCVNGQWKSGSCTDLCKASGYTGAKSCSYDSTQKSYLCYCDAGSCVNNTSKCASSTTLSVCENSSWKTIQCDQLCKAGGMGKSDGCQLSSGTYKCICYSGYIGDPCTYNSDCTQGVCGAAGWCTKVCTGDSDCGSSTIGYTNPCMSTSASMNVCFPYCITDSDCAGFYGTKCYKSVTSVSGKTVNVCATP